MAKTNLTAALRQATKPWKNPYNGIKWMESIDLLAKLVLPYYFIASPFINNFMLFY